MQTLPAATRRALVAGAPLAALLALGHQPVDAKRRKKKPKPPIAAFIAQFQSASLGNQSSDPTIITAWSVSGWDLRSDFAVAFPPTTVTLFSNADRVDEIARALRSNVATFQLDVSGSMVDRIIMVLL